MLSSEPGGYQWALPEGMEVPPDELRARLDFYQNATVLYFVEDSTIHTKMVSAQEVTMALLSRVQLGSGLLPPNTLWWRQTRQGVEYGLWRRPQVWRVAVVVDPFEPPRRFKVPMPGLIFICSAGKPPRVFAARRRPESPQEAIYHAPLFNLFGDGQTCAGTHNFPDKVGDIPESFFRSFFSIEAQFRRRSLRHPDSLLALWEELNGKKRYPMRDLVEYGALEDVMQ